MDNLLLDLEWLYLYNQGLLYHSYLHLGAHFVEEEGRFGVRFALWAPHARAVRVVGEFNKWQPEMGEMSPQGQTGIWAVFIEGVQAGALYKYEIETAKGVIQWKSDPYAFSSEPRPLTASRVFDLRGYVWQDRIWQERHTSGLERSPLLIYEVHLGSWQRREDGGFLTYRSLAEPLIEHVKALGYTHIEFMPLMEHPFDGSWGYQITGFYSATSRYGSPHDLMYLIDQCHQAGLGVILDWVPGHFCRDAHGLALFDGSPLYESEAHEQWGTFKFDFSRPEVQSFLLSNALFWLEVFHADGLRVDGVTSMLMLNFGKAPGQGRTNIHGGQEDLAAVEFLRRLNQLVRSRCPKALMIAEESSAWPGVTHPVESGGLGFHLKWNMGWMNDVLTYFETPFHQRNQEHQRLTFSMVYAFSEAFVLPLSHDEVVHGKKSLIQKMPGDYEAKFAGLRLLHLYWLCHPGKKLMFMGGEFAQFIEWREYESLEWFLLEYPLHRHHMAFVASAHHFYRREPALWEGDGGWEGFEWLEVHGAAQRVLAFARSAPQSGTTLVAVFNFGLEPFPRYRIGVPESGTYRQVFRTETLAQALAGPDHMDRLATEDVAWQGKAASLVLPLAPLTGILLRYEGPIQENAPKKRRTTDVSG